MVEQARQDYGTMLKLYSIFIMYVLAEYLGYEAVIVLSGLFHLIGYICQPHHLSLYLLPPGF